MADLGGFVERRRPNNRTSKSEPLPMHKWFLEMLHNSAMALSDGVPFQSCEVCDSTDVIVASEDTGH